MHELTTSASKRLYQLLPLGGHKATPPPTTTRVFQLDARFERYGAWAGVDQLAEIAYRSLLEIEQETIVEQHLLELYMVLVNHRHRIRPKYLCLTDTASIDEKTRFYALDRAYRLIHGLVGMILKWIRALGDQRGWIVIVRHFDQAEHLSQRFFAELARRSASGHGIDVIVETAGPIALPLVRTSPAAEWMTTIAPAPTDTVDISDAEAPLLEAQVAGDMDVALQHVYLTLLRHFRARDDGLKAAEIAMKILLVYNNCGYYFEAKHFMGIVLPYFDALVENSEAKRIYYVSKMNICLVSTGERAGALEVVEDLAAFYLTGSHGLAEMNYIQAMYHLRHAEKRDLATAERHILRAVEIIHAVDDDPDSYEHNFLKVFIDNGLAFLRARQGRHQEAIDLCRSGYEFLTWKLGGGKQRLHRSVLLYNIAQVYVMVGRIDDGLEYYGKASAMDPDYSEYYNEIGNILQEQGRYQSAIDSYLRAIERSAPYPEVYFNKAVCHLRQGELEDALSCFQFTLELNPNQPAAHALQADVLRELGSADAALEAYDTAIALGYESTAARVNRAVLYYNNGAYSQALSDMDYVIGRDAHDPAHYENRAAIHQAMRRQDLYDQDMNSAERYREMAS
jgi:tetratricopeptide (TPR) repeat protein